MPGGQTPFDGPITIDVEILNPTDPDTVKLYIETDLRYVSVVEEYDDTITWNLQVPLGVTAYFDSPAIAFPGEDPGTLNPVRTPTSVTIDWSNTDSGRKGLSFHYQLYILIVIDEVIVPIDNDPTVHNDPPTSPSPI